MFIKKITIKNFRLFRSGGNFEIDDINIPDNENDGSGLNIFVGENGSGKTALLEAFSLPLLDYKAESFSMEDFNNPEEESLIDIYAEENFEVVKTIRGSFSAKGFSFKAKMRERSVSAYLSSLITSDRKFIQADGEKIEADSPDLRMSVNNPWRLKRFDKNDILFLDNRSRTLQIRSGAYNKTRFDRLMEDFNYQYIKSMEAGIIDLNDDLNEKIKKDKVKNDFLSEAVSKFQEISGYQINLDFLNNYEPFKKSFFLIKKDNNQQIALTNLGSGYEIIFSLLCTFYLAQQSGKDLIILIDEPELHLHPKLQKEFVKILLQFSKRIQIIIASHSPLLVKQLSENEKTKVRVLENDGRKVLEIKEKVLPYVSANETNFLAFNLATEEYHNELYEELKSTHGVNKDYKSFDNDFFVTIKGEPKNSPWRENQNEVSRHTFIRNQIHHQAENGKTRYDDLKASIEAMRNFF